jgi:hypothetical protein
MKLKRAILFIQFILFSILLNAQNINTQKGEYTLKTVLNKTVAWSSDALNYNQYRFIETAKQLLANVAGSTIKIDQFFIDSKAIRVNKNNQAAYIAELNSTESFNEWGLDHFNAKVAPMDQVGKENRLKSVQILIIENSDKMALELNGKTTISLTGRIKDIRLWCKRYTDDGDDESTDYASFFIWIEVLKWNQ